MKKISYIDNAVSFKDIAKDNEDESIIIKGYPTTPDIDRTNDIIESLAFSDSIDTYTKASGSIFFNHDWNEPVGKILSYIPPDENNSFLITAKIYPDINEKVYKMVKYGVVKSFSVGFFIKDYVEQKINGKNITIIKDADLIDISIVTVPANPNANFEMVKSLIKSVGIKNFEKLINDENNLNIEKYVSKDSSGNEDEEFISVKKCDMDRLLKSVDEMVSYFIRLMDKLSSDQKEEFCKMMSNIKNLKK